MSPPDIYEPPAGSELRRFLDLVDSGKYDERGPCRRAVVQSPFADGVEERASSASLGDRIVFEMLTNPRLSKWLGELWQAHRRAGEREIWGFRSEMDTLLTLGGRLATDLCLASPCPSGEVGLAEAKEICDSAVAELVDSRYEEAYCFVAQGPWSSWFEGTYAWDLSYMLVDYGRRRSTLICMTDSPLRFYYG